MGCGSTIPNRRGTVDSARGRVLHHGTTIAASLWYSTITARSIERSHVMPEKKTIKKARKDKREGKSPTTQAGEFVREEMHHIREGKHGARSAKQAIAIGLSKARRAGVKLPPPEKGEASEKTRKS